MDLREMTAGDTVDQMSTVFFLIMGYPGVGKTRLGALMPRPLHLLFEKQGEPTVKQWNKQLILIKIYQDDRAGTYTGVPLGMIDDPTVKLAKLEHILNAVMRGEPHESGRGVWVPSPQVVRGEDGTYQVVDYSWEAAVWIESVVLDTLTEYQEIVFNQLLGRKARENAVIPFGSEGMGKHYQNLNRRTEELCRTMRDLPVHAMALGHVAEKDTTGGVKTMLALSGDKVSPTLPRLATACGWLVCDDSNGEVSRFCVFDGAGKVAVVKWCLGLQAVEPVPSDPGESGPADWIEHILNASAETQGGLPEASAATTAGALATVQRMSEESRAAALRKEAKRKSGKGGKSGGWIAGRDGDDGGAAPAADTGSAPATGRTIRRSELAKG